MIHNMRSLIWEMVRSHVPEGSLLPIWARIVRAILFPLDYIFWKLSKTRGYQWETDTWLIDGIEYSGLFFHYLAEADGEIYRVTRVGETVKFERIKSI